MCRKGSESKKCHLLGRGSSRLGSPGRLLPVLAAGDDCIINDNTDDSSVDTGLDAGNVDTRGIDTGVDARGIDAGCINVGSVDSGSVDSGSLDDDNVVTSSECTQLTSLIAEERSKLGVLECLPTTKEPQ